MLTILTPIHITPNVRSYRTHSFKNILKYLSKITEVQIVWLVYKPEKINGEKYSDENNIVLDIHDYENATDVIKKIQPNIIWAAPTLNLPDFALSIAGKKLGIVNDGVLQIPDEEVENNEDGVMMIPPVTITTTTTNASILPRQSVRHRKTNKRSRLDNNPGHFSYASWPVHLQ